MAHLSAVVIFYVLSAAAATPISLLQRASHCANERRALQEPEPSRGGACDACFAFKDYPGGEHVQPNAHLCRTCYSVKSSCDDSKFAFSCYDENAQFANFKKNGANPAADEPGEMHSDFKDKEPEKCE